MRGEWWRGQGRIFWLLWEIVLLECGSMELSCFGKCFISLSHRKSDTSLPVPLAPTLLPPLLSTSLLLRSCPPLHPTPAPSSPSRQTPHPHHHHYSSTTRKLRYTSPSHKHTWQRMSMHFRFLKRLIVVVMDWGIDCKLRSMNGRVGLSMGNGGSNGLWAICFVQPAMHTGLSLLQAKTVIITSTAHIPPPPHCHFRIVILL